VCLPTFWEWGWSDLVMLLLLYLFAASTPLTTIRRSGIASRCRRVSAARCTDGLFRISPEGVKVYYYSLLSGRLQFVRCGSSLTLPKAVLCGVPPGSIGRSVLDGSSSGYIQQTCSVLFFFIVLCLYIMWSCSLPTLRKVNLIRFLHFITRLRENLSEMSAYQCRSPMA